MSLKLRLDVDSIIVDAPYFVRFSLFAVCKSLPTNDLHEIPFHVLFDFLSI